MFNIDKLLGKFKEATPALPKMLGRFSDNERKFEIYIFRKECKLHVQMRTIDGDEASLQNVVIKRKDEYQYCFYGDHYKPITVNVSHGVLDQFIEILKDHLKDDTTAILPRYDIPEITIDDNDQFIEILKDHLKDDTMAILPKYDIPEIIIDDNVPFSQSKNGDDNVSVLRRNISGSKTHDKSLKFEQYIITFKRENVEGDGNCGWRSLAKIHYGSQDEYLRLKIEVLTYYSENIEKRIVSNSRHDKVLENMAIKDGSVDRNQWMCTFIGIPLACHYLKRPIIYYCEDSEVWHPFVPYRLDLMNGKSPIIFINQIKIIMSR
ncbi:hypothetical protein ROZALSC1DRAFT_24947 [Rozella allomycis CSF55]|uniref:OTU domain-containing protein n=1 Tax=Rozella allomycis (strain CSF55) TaxID=988480 RepID=A0A4P9YCH5_ROZAC|nr:hypothetical protein ROZALSC1DRAFT_24947 [Rozella allomycis CSF55]